jgi:hypothetical protein
VIADGGGCALAFQLAPGQAHELPMARVLPDRLPKVPTWVVADHGYTSHALREYIWTVALGLPFHRSAMKCRSPARPGSITTAIGSSGSGHG